MRPRAIAAISCVLAFAAVAFAILVFQPESSTGGPHVAEVIDGDTFVYESADGKQTTIRLIGIDTPETVKPDTPVMCGGPEAHAYLQHLIGDAGDLKIVLGDNPTDTYGRTLAYVYDQGTVVNAAMADSGWARYDTFDDNDRYAPVFEQLVHRAIDNGKGIWSGCPHAIEWATGEADQP